jgi:hypothetical protein
MQSNSLTAGTLGGTALSLVPQITSDDIGRTIVLAVIGASVSYLVSIIWKCVWTKHDKKRD